MSKPFGYYRKYQRSKAIYKKVKNQNAFNDYAERQRSPVARELFTQGLLEYSPTGDVKVKPEAVKQAAFEFVKESQDVELDRKSRVEQQAAFIARGRQVENPDQAINRHYANRANAILLAARLGQVELSHGQRNRLAAAGEGQYLDLVYSQYRSGDLGTVEYQARARAARQPKRSATAEGRAIAQAKREEFAYNTGRNRAYSRA